MHDHVKQALCNLVAATGNLHVGIPALLGFALTVSSFIWPKHAQLFAQIICAGMSYGIIAAGNSSQTLTPDGPVPPVKATITPTGETKAP